MKEKSIEEKAYNGNYKTYTELINRLEDVKDAIKKQNYGIAMDILYKPYPEFQITTSTELKENEDEKIRKQITGFITYSRVLDETKKNWLTWLEKQGKNNIGISEATKQKLEDSLKEALEKETAESFNAFLDEQGEQKDILEDAILDSNKDGLIADTIRYKKEKQGEQKPAWSEENENRFNNLIFLVECSKEGEATKQGFIKFINRLKSLRPQNTWKPSDEQIKALLKLEEMHVLEHEKNKKNAHLYMMVKSIREQLLKLMEE